MKYPFWRGKKGSEEATPLQIVSVITQIAISRTVSRFKFSDSGLIGAQNDNHEQRPSSVCFLFSGYLFVIGDDVYAAVCAHTPGTLLLSDVKLGALFFTYMQTHNKCKHDTLWSASAGRLWGWWWYTHTPPRKGSVGDGGRVTGDTMMPSKRYIMHHTVLHTASGMFVLVRTMYYAHGIV